MDQKTGENPSPPCPRANMFCFNGPNADPRCVFPFLTSPGVYEYTIDVSRTGPLGLDIFHWDDQNLIVESFPIANFTTNIAGINNDQRKRQYILDPNLGGRYEFRITIS